MFNLEGALLHAVSSLKLSSRRVCIPWHWLQCYFPKWSGTKVFCKLFMNVSWWATFYTYLWHLSWNFILPDSRWKEFALCLSFQQSAFPGPLTIPALWREMFWLQCLSLRNDRQNQDEGFLPQRPFVGCKNSHAFPVSMSGWRGPYHVWKGLEELALRRELSKSELGQEDWKEQAFEEGFTCAVNFTVWLFNRPLTSRFINKILINKFQGYSSNFPGELFSSYLVPETSNP